jgi:hypothetical protein
MIAEEVTKRASSLNGIQVLRADMATLAQHAGVTVEVQL